MDKKKGICFIAHGSPYKEGNVLFVEWADKIKEYLPGCQTTYAFLEAAEPEIQTALQILVSKGCEEITLFPLFLFVGKHLLEDIPKMVDLVATQNKEVNFKRLPDLYVMGLLYPLLESRIFNLSKIVNDDNTVFLFAVVGSSVKSTNLNARELINTLCAQHHISNFQIGFFSAFASPSFSELIKKYANKKIVCLPLLLFPGYYLKKLNALAMDLQIDIQITPLLAEGDDLHRLVADKLLEDKVSNL